MNRTARFFAALALAGTAIVAALPACSDVPDASCEERGGVTRNGVCEGKCTPEGCVAGNTCVENRCVLVCEGHDDCFPDGSQDCVPAKEDGTGNDIQVCRGNGKATGTGVACISGTECQTDPDTDAPTHFAACPNGAPCGPDQCDGNPAACVRDNVACAGAADCTIGRCPVPAGSTTGTYTRACTVTGPGLTPPCSDSECRPLACVSKSAGDPEAYCTHLDCAADADCPGGYTCGAVRDPHEICGSMPKKGNDALCGKTTEPCIDPATPPAGTSYFEGKLCLMRKLCLKAAACTSCKTDLDCSVVPDQKCAAASGGEKGCATLCTKEADCKADEQCDATAGACLPRFGACHGDGALCSPCRGDLDCGDPAADPKDYAAVCVTDGGPGACAHQPPDEDCMTEADCPKAPNGQPGACLDEGESIFPSDVTYHKCYLPYDAEAQKFACW